MAGSDWPVECFERDRPHLRVAAFPMLGSLTAVDAGGRSRRCSPSLPRGLAGDAEAGADLSPGVATQALDRLGYGDVDPSDRPGMRARASTSTSRRAYARTTRRTNAPYSFSTRRCRFNDNRSTGVQRW
jgi:hypothetical protein